ncbi:MAG: GAF domain-containing protein [Myxococcota bacterium]
MARSDQPDPLDHGAALLDLFARGTELTRQLVDETERLRRLARDVDRGPQPGADGVPGAFPRPSDVQLEALRVENHALLARLRSAEASNLRWAERHAETERCHDDLANLFVASDQLHATRDSGEVVAAICEIVINLVGAEIFALYTFDPDRERLVPIVGEGRPLDRWPEVALGEGAIGRAVESGRVRVAEAGAVDGDAGRSSEPLAIVPLCARGSALGAIVIDKLLDQKPCLSELDRQLFELLAQHGSKALLLAGMQAPTRSIRAGTTRSIDRITN